MGFSNKDAHKHVTDYEADMFTGITTYHGFVRIYNSKNWRSRAFWILIVTTAFTIFTVQAYSLIKLYKGKPTLYQSNIHVPEVGIDFPDVTVCNFNPVKLSIAKEWKEDHNMSEDVFEYLLMTYKPMENLYTYVLNSTKPRPLEDHSTLQTLETLENELKKFSAEYKRTNDTTFLIQNFFNESGYSCEDLFLECAFAGFIVKDCCNYTKPILTDIGKCFTLSGFGETERKNRQFIAGSDYGLQMVLDVKNDEYSHIGASDHGIIFHAHRKEERPFLSARGVAIPPGHKGYAAITLTNCRDSWHKEDSVYLEKYTMTNCQANCMANLFQKLCGCVPMRFFINEKLDVCSPLAMFHCLNITTLYKGGIHRPVQLNDDYKKDNYVMVNVFMKDIAYTKHIQQQGISATTILSDIGGNTGMFLGMSVITLGEIFVFFTKFAWGLISKKRQETIMKRESQANLTVDTFAEGKI